MGYLAKRFRMRLPIIVMLIPFFTLFIIFTVYPVVRSIWYSFTYYNVFSEPEFIGFKNYTRLFLEDSVFLTALKNTLVFAVITGPVGYLLSLLVAWLINDLHPKFRWFLTASCCSWASSTNRLPGSRIRAICWRLSLSYSCG